jgi:DNA polymerase I
MTYPSVQIHEPIDNVQLRLVQDTDDSMELLRWLSTKDEIAIDTETTGLDKETDRVRLVQVGDAMTGWAINFERNAQLVDDIVKRFEGMYDMHNAPYDQCMLARGGVTIPTWRIKDTRLMLHVLSSTGSLALKNASQRLIDPRAAALQQQLDDALGKHGKLSWKTVPIGRMFDPYWMYGAFDTVLTKRLCEIIEPQVQATAPESYELEMAVAWVCERMSRKGTAVDREYTADYMDKMSQYVDELELWCRQNYHLSPGSTDAVVKALERDGVTFTKRTAGGAVSLDKEVLSRIDHPLAQVVLTRRRAQKTLTTYLTNYLDASARDGRIHPSINTVGGMGKNPFETGGSRGVRTGRMSMDSPNLQNVPVRTTEGKRVRNCFVPSCSERCGCGEEHMWIKCDFDQVEMRIFAHMSRDDNLINAFVDAERSGVDMFTSAARRIFHDDSIQRSDKRRQYVKNGFYAILYGAGTEQFGRTAGMMIDRPIIDVVGEEPIGYERVVDISAASDFLQALHHSYPGIRNLQRQIEQEAYENERQTGEAFTNSPLTNRKFTADRGREYALMNYAVQGTAGEVLKKSILLADQAGLGEYMTFPVHDEIDLDVPKHLLPDVRDTLRDVMNHHDLLDVPITSTMAIGERWGNVEDE